MLLHHQSFPPWNMNFFCFKSFFLSHFLNLWSDQSVWTGVNFHIYRPSKNKLSHLKFSVHHRSLISINLSLLIEYLCWIWNEIWFCVTTWQTCNISWLRGWKHTLWVKHEVNISTRVQGKKGSVGFQSWWSSHQQNSTWPRTVFTPSLAVVIKYTKVRKVTH